MLGQTFITRSSPGVSLRKVTNTRNGRRRIELHPALPCQRNAPAENLSGACGRSTLDYGFYCCLGFLFVNSLPYHLYTTPLPPTHLDAELDVERGGLLGRLAEDVDVPLGLVLERDVEADVVVLAELLNLLDVVLVELDVERLEV